MALPYEVNFTVEDGAGKKANGKFFIDSAQTVANAQTEAAGMLQNIADDCSGSIIAASLRLPVDVSALTTNTADAQSNVAYGHRFLLRSAEGHRAELNIPAADQSNSVDNSNDLNGEALTVETQIITRPITTSHDEPVTVVTDSYETWGGKRRTL